MPLNLQAEAIAPYVAYEYVMFLKGIEHLDKYDGRDSYHSSVVLESILTHARNVRDFLFTRRRWPTDVIAQDFFDNEGDWIVNVEALCAYMTAQKARLDRSLAHVSYDRLDFELDKDWNLAALASELQPVWKQFLGKLSDERRNWFIDHSLVVGSSGTSPAATTMATADYTPKTGLTGRTDSQITKVYKSYVW